METIHKNWPISELVEKMGQIDFPEFQREPTVWKLDKKQRLIDSILRGFDISSIYLYEKENGGWDCIDGRQRINAILSYLGINGADEDDNGFHLRIENEIYDDGKKFSEIDQKRYSSIKGTEWDSTILKYKLNIVEVKNVEDDQELNLLFLRLQIASVLNAGEKLHAMTGDMRDAIFKDIGKNEYFIRTKIQRKRYVLEQVAAQIVINEFSRRDESGAFHRTRYEDLQDFFKRYDRFEPKDEETIHAIKTKLDKIVKYFSGKLVFISSRAIAVSVYLFVSKLLDSNKEEEISQFVDFFDMFLRTLKWQIPKGVKMDLEYHDLLKFQTNVNQAAGEKSAIERRQEFLEDYFHYYKDNGKIKRDDEYEKRTKNKADAERKKAKL
jgi:hypothetical protein